MLESGRNSLLESAQQATFISVATAALDVNATNWQEPHCQRKFTRAAGKTMELRAVGFPTLAVVFVFAVIGTQRRVFVAG